MSQENSILKKDFNSLLNSKKINKGDLNDVMNCMDEVSYKKIFYINIIQDKYRTQFFIKKANINGYENIYGAFRSISKNKNPEKPQNIEPSYYYINNYEPQYKKNMNNNKLYLTNDNNNINPEKEMIKKTIMFLFLAIIILLVIDFIKIYKQIKNEYKLEREKCQKEFDANNCNKVTIDDGDWLNDFCIDKMKCINNHFIYFHEVLIKYIKNILFTSFKGCSIYNIILVIFTILIIFRIFF